MDDIKTTSGKVVGRWNGESARELMTEIARIKKILIHEKSADTLESRSMPHRDQLHKDLLEFKAYHLWGCDRHGECLVGTNANRIESVDKVLSFSLIDHH
jgi:hypothetical protein